MANRKKNKGGLGYRIYSWLHRRKMPGRRSSAALTPYAYSRVGASKAFQTVGLKPGFLTRRLEKHGQEIQQAGALSRRGRVIHTKRR